MPTYNAGMSAKPPTRRAARRPKAVQYTVRAVPAEIDAALRERARRDGRSLNDVTLEALRRGLGLNAGDGPRNDLGRFAGAWVEDSAFNEMMEAFDRIDADLWR